jgi:hypothetical protein
MIFNKHFYTLNSYDTSPSPKSILEIWTDDGSVLRAIQHSADSAETLHKYFYDRKTKQHSKDYPDPSDCNKYFIKCDASDESVDTVLRTIFAEELKTAQANAFSYGMTLEAIARLNHLNYLMNNLWKKFKGTVEQNPITP